MKQKITFNTHLHKYKKYLHKLNRLQITGRNERRQNILKKHIARLEQKLGVMLTQIKRTRVTTAMAVTTMLVVSNNIQAQTFDDREDNPFGLTDIGDYSRPALVDLDNDGDLDILSGTVHGNFHYFENTGSSTEPEFAVVQANPFGLTDIGGHSSPTFVDLDGDGDLDMLSGGFVGNFQYFENTGTAITPEFAVVQANPFGLTNIGLASSPAFVDLDDDGDLDMLAGENDGNFHYFENTGSSTEPAFAAVEENPFGLTDIGWTSSPTFVDLDGDGDFDMLAGGYGYQEAANFYYFENAGTNSAPTFNTVQENPFNLSGVNVDNYNRTMPVFGDLDNDGDFDILSGVADGEFYYYENTTIVLSNPAVEANKAQLLLFPNPTSEVLNISIAEHLNINHVSIVDITGKVVQEKVVTTNSNELTLQVNDLAKGIYTVNINTNTSTVTKKLVIK